MSDIQQTVESYFQEYGWTFERPQEHQLTTTFEGEHGSFLLTAEITDHWICLTVAAYILSTESTTTSELTSELLRLNYSIPLIKFALDDASNVVISVDLPIAELTYGLFEVAVDMLSYAADAHMPKLLELAIE